MTDQRDLEDAVDRAIERRFGFGPQDSADDIVRDRIFLRDLRESVEARKAQKWTWRDCISWIVPGTIGGLATWLAAKYGSGSHP